MVATRFVDWAAELFGYIIVLVPLKIDRFAYKVCCVQKTQSQEGQNEPSRSAKQEMTLKDHRQPWGKRAVVTYSTDAIRCGEPEVLHMRLRREIQRGINGGVGRTTGALPL